MSNQELNSDSRYFQQGGLLTFVCGICGSTPAMVEIIREHHRQAWHAECCGKKGAGVLSDRQRNLLTIGRPVQIQAIVGEGVA